MLLTLFIISIISFLVIQAPPGDYMSTYVARLAAQGEQIDESQVVALRARYGINQPIVIQYLKWLRGVLRGDLGRSLEWNRSVKSLILERLPWSVMLSCASLLIVYLVGVPIGTLSATRQYSLTDYFFTLVGFIGLAIPNFLLALLLLWVYFLTTGNVAVGLFSAEYALAPWSIGKVIDLLKHLWMPALIVGTAGTAGIIRIMRATLLDELRKQYVIVARSKGLAERTLLYKYPFRIAINPLVSTIGWTLPTLISGELLVSMVLGIPTIAPIFLNSLLSEDMLLASSIVLILSALTVVGTLISDVLLALVDPRVVESV
jgi:peptide/nickel transport system permease protein